MIHNNILIRETIDFNTKKNAWIVRPLNTMDKTSRNILYKCLKKHNGKWSRPHRGYIFKYNPVNIIKSMDIVFSKKSSYKIIMKNKEKYIKEKIIKYEKYIKIYKDIDEKKVKYEKKIEKAYESLDRIIGKEVAYKKLINLKSKLKIYKNKLRIFEDLIKKEKNKYGFELDKDSIKMNIESFSTLIIETEEKIEYWLEVLRNEN